MMRTFLSFLLLATAAAFTPSATHSLTRSSPRTSIIMKEGLGIDPERKKLTRENEPDDYFVTNTDKMTDQEKIPIAIAGLVGISLPFILGLIALYSAK
ncbi:hypothetical protein ACHAWO_009185 [Cyclotella atomus]|uniref:Uncharacterized protein n=1 Tax=Cyclotella atomus TaxID=382360 RepID=A0ABD3NU85_9STRA